jgi:hypothetical protein
MCRSLLEGMAALPSLQSLSFEVMITAAQGKEFAKLSELKTLTTLNVSIYHHIRLPDYLDHSITIPKMALLQHLMVRRSGKPYIYPAKVKLGSIGHEHRSIVIGDGVLIATAIPKNPHLERLHCWSDCQGMIESFKTIGVIANATALRSLVLHTNINKKHLNEIAQHRESLTSLHIFGSLVTIVDGNDDDDEDNKAAPVDVPVPAPVPVAATGPRRGAKPAIIDSPIQPFTKLLNLEMLTLPSITMASTDILMLSTLTNLRSLSTANPIGHRDEGTSFMTLVKERLPQLELVFGQPRQQWLTTYDKV